MASSSLSAFPGEFTLPTLRLYPPRAAAEDLGAGFRERTF
jgi:hypothetical protein